MTGLSKLQALRLVVTRSTRSSMADRGGSCRDSDSTESADSVMADDRPLDGTVTTTMLVLVVALPVACRACV
jgi:hypothetical protein